MLQLFDISAPCSNVICENNTDTCKAGVCQCGNAGGFKCDVSSELPLCYSGVCSCSKNVGTFEIGDGTTQGSCLSSKHKCQVSGRCVECVSDSQCSGLSDTCRNNKCVCGNGAACNPTKSSQCTDGVCKCGTNPECASSEYIEILPTCSTNSVLSCYDNIFPNNTHICLLPRSSSEVCELISDKYNPIYIPGNAAGATLKCDDNKGKFHQTHQCLGKKIEER